VDEVSLLRRKIIEKEREIERLQTEVQSKNKGKPLKTKCVDNHYICVIIVYCRVEHDR
jgi:hypothetical protein